MIELWNLGILFTILFLVYAYNKGCKQALVWNSNKGIDSGKYHLNASLKSLSQIGIIYILSIILFGPIVATIRVLAAIFFIFWIYREVFIRKRIPKQNNISPSWDWDIKILGKTFFIPYLPASLIRIFGIVGLLINFIKI